MNKDVLRQVGVVITLIATVVINGLANALPLNGLTTGEISDSFPVFFVPAGYVFGIWGLIYLGLIAFTIYQALPGQRENPRMRRIGYWFALSNLANGAWIFLWHYQVFPLTLLAMLVVLLSLIVIYERLEIGRQMVTGLERWFVNLPFSIYLGWITVATIANVTIVLDDLGWNGWGIAPEAWAAIMLVVATIVAGLLIARRGDVAFAGVIIWAFVGIAVKQAGTPLVAGAALVMSVIVLGLLMAHFFRNRQAGQLSGHTHAS
jgi:hypothetical protein